MGGVKHYSKQSKKPEDNIENEFIVPPPATVTVGFTPFKLAAISTCPLSGLPAAVNISEAALVFWFASFERILSTPCATAITATPIANPPATAGKDAIERAPAIIEPIPTAAPRKMPPIPIPVAQFDSVNALSVTEMLNQRLLD